MAPVHVAVTSVGTYYIETDQLNTPRRITNAANQVVWQWDNNDPFGANIPNQDPNSTGTAFEFNLRFPGQYFDKETNLHYNYFRDYDPTTGRYVQSDPIGLDGGINTYTYVENNPISYVDPEGLAATGASIGGAFGGAIGGRVGPIGAIAGRAIWAAAGSAIEDACKPDDPPCSPPEGTQCYEGPDTTHSHAGLNPHYHIFQMFKFGGKCQWKYLGGKVGKGVLAMPPAGMSACSSYPGFQGR